MADFPIHGAQTPEPVQGPGSSSGAKRTHERPEGTPAFHALLEDLQQRATELRRSSAEVSQPEHLAGAVDRARASLEDALSLSDRLLEAYREAVHQDDTSKSHEDLPGSSANE